MFEDRYEIGFVKGFPKYLSLPWTILEDGESPRTGLYLHHDPRGETLSLPSEPSFLDSRIRLGMIRPSSLSLVPFPELTKFVNSNCGVISKAEDNFVERKFSKNVCESANQEYPGDTRPVKTRELQVLY